MAKWSVTLEYRCYLVVEAEDEDSALEIADSVTTIHTLSLENWEITPAPDHKRAVNED